MATYRVEITRGSISSVSFVEARNAADAFDLVVRSAVFEPAEGKAEKVS